jgi:chromosome segregation ATPase
MRDNITEEEAHRQTALRGSQLTLFSLQADKKRMERKYTTLEAEIRQLHTQMNHLKADIEVKTVALHSVTKEIEMMEGEIVHMKKHMNSL